MVERRRFHPPRVLNQLHQVPVDGRGRHVAARGPLGRGDARVEPTRGLGPLHLLDVRHQVVPLHRVLIGELLPLHELRHLQAACRRVDGRLFRAELRRRHELVDGRRRNEADVVGREGGGRRGPVEVGEDLGRGVVAHEGAGRVLLQVVLLQVKVLLVVELRAAGGGVGGGRPLDGVGGRGELGRGLVGEGDHPRVLNAGRRCGVAAENVFEQNLLLLVIVCLR